MRERFEKFWFAPAPAEGIAGLRIVFFSYLIARYAGYDFAALASVDGAFWTPMGVFAGVGDKPIFPLEWIRLTQVLWKLAMVASVLGFRTGIATGASFVLGALLLSWDRSLNTTSHLPGLFTLLLGVFAFARCGGAFSVDAWIAGRRQRSSGEFRWPLQLMRVIHTFVYFGAGVSKLRHGGLEWMSADHLRILIRQLDTISPQKAYLAQWLSLRPELCGVAAAAVLLLELSFPLVLFSPFARRVLLPATMLMHVGIRLTLGITSMSFLFLLVLWLPWEKAAGWRLLLKPSLCDSRK